MKYLTFKRYLYEGGYGKFSGCHYLVAKKALHVQTYKYRCVGVNYIPSKNMPVLLYINTTSIIIIINILRNNHNNYQYRIHNSIAHPLIFDHNE